MPRVHPCEQGPELFLSDLDIVTHGIHKQYYQHLERDHKLQGYWVLPGTQDQVNLVLSGARLEKKWSLDWSRAQRVSQ